MDHRIDMDYNPYDVLRTEKDHHSDSDSDYDCDLNASRHVSQSNKTNISFTPVRAFVPSFGGTTYSQEFTCGICYELMVEPSTLQCGHSFCRHCLAASYLSSKKQECPACRQWYYEVPKVSFTLRSTIQNHMPDEYEKRKNFVLTPESRADIIEFERSCDKSKSQLLLQQLNAILRAQNLQVPQLRQQRREALVWQDPKTYIGLVVISAIAIMIWTAAGWLFGASSAEPIANKPMTKWTEPEASQWLTELGPWADQALSHKFAELHIDGSLLSALTEDDLKQMSNDLDDLHKRAFIIKRDETLNRSVKQIADFWEYKEAHLFKTQWLNVFCQYFPREAILYLWLFDYTDGFLLLVHSTCPVQDMESVSLYNHNFPAPTSGQWLDFTFRWLLVPHLGVFVDFTYKNVWPTNKFTAGWIMLCLSMLALVEVLNVMVLLQLSRRENKNAVRSAMKTLLDASLMQLLIYTFWNLIPTIIVNIFFYFKFITSVLNLWVIVLLILKLKELMTRHQ